MEQSLWNAAKNGSEDQVRKILAENPVVDVNRSGESGYRPLHWACQNGNDQIVSLLLARPDLNVNQKNNSSLTPLMLACMRGHDVCAGLLLSDPRIKVNLGDNNSTTALSMACMSGRGKVVTLLLAHPDINVNQKSGGFATSPFMEACKGGFVDCVRPMLKDPRVDVNATDAGESTPMYCAARNGHMGVIKWWIASGREIDLGKPGDLWKTDAIGIAKRREKHEVVSLLERFRDHPEQTRYQTRQELRWYDVDAAANYALMIFLCDELLSLTEAAETTNPEAIRFLRMASRLPMELQMLVSNMATGSAQRSIGDVAAEKAFSDLAKKLMKK